MNTDFLDSLFEVINKDLVILVNHYGNKDGNDVNLFVVTNDDTYCKQKKEGLLSIRIVGGSYFHRLISVFDPVITEPILTGEVVYGDDVNGEKKYLASLVSNKNTLKHLLDNSEIRFMGAEECLRDGELKEAMVNMVFCLSYLEFARYYKTKKEVISFKELLAKNSKSLLAEVHRRLKGKSISHEETFAFFGMIKIKLETDVRPLRRVDFV